MKVHFDSLQLARSRSESSGPHRGVHRAEVQAAHHAPQVSKGTAHAHVWNPVVPQSGNFASPLPFRQNATSLSFLVISRLPVDNSCNEVITAIK